ncbi:MAG: hypothetical protein EXR43_03870 [Dehalococcoidia bacterium]|nr:hypothetical protein [Dehalococcoidia bacterium]
MRCSCAWHRRSMSASQRSTSRRTGSAETSSLRADHVQYRCMTPHDVNAAPAAGRDSFHYRFMVVLARHFPDALGSALGAVVADASYWLFPAKRRAALRNYAQVLGTVPSDARARQLARRAFRNFGRYVAEIFRLQVMSPEQLRGLIQVQNMEHLYSALAHERGVIFVSAHIGNMEAGSAALPLYGYRLLAAADRLRPDFIWQYILRARAQWGVSLVPVEHAGRRILQALRRQRMVALVADVGLKATGGVRVSFFGKETYFPSGPARIARLSGAPLVFGCAVRNSRGTYDIVLGAPVLPSRTVDAIRDMESMTQQVVDQLEALIRRFPDQWYMFRDMWPLKELPPRLQPALAEEGDATPAAS